MNISDLEHLCSSGSELFRSDQLYRTNSSIRSSRSSEACSFCSWCVGFLDNSRDYTNPLCHQVPETKGVTLEEMEDVFGNTDGLATADLARLDAIYRRLGLVSDTHAHNEKNDEEVAKVSHEDETSEEKN